MEHSLRRKIRYFLSSHYRGRSEMHSVLEGIKSFGPTVVIGGILRDLALSNNLQFRSDVDLVVDPREPVEFQEYLVSTGAEINRFGGFKLPSHRWEIDVWLLEETWANRAGYVKVNQFPDLLGTTFFNCDAIICDLIEGKIWTKPGYFEELGGRALEINLEPNPNPVGNAVRAFRYAAEKNFRWGPRLCRFVAAILEETGWQALIEYERKSYGTRVLEQEADKHFIGNLVGHIERDKQECFNPIRKGKWVQLALPLEIG